VGATRAIRSDPEQAEQAAAAALLAAPAALRGVSPQTVLARALAGGAALPNRSTARMLARADREFALMDEYVDELAAGTPEPAAAEAPANSGTLAAMFRSEIQKQLKRFSGAPAVEGTKAFDDFISPQDVALERKTTKNWTSCIKTLDTIFRLAADEVNKRAGATVQTRTSKSGHTYYVDGMYGTVKYTARSDAPDIASKVGAWVPWTSGATPKSGDILILADKDKSYFYFSHITFFLETGTTEDGRPTWVTIDGGQGTKGTWNDKGYVEGSGKQEIKRRDRLYLSDKGHIEGEPSQGRDMRKVHGWVDVEKLVKDPAATAAAAG
jgi:hypothetical protein